MHPLAIELGFNGNVRLVHQLLKQLKGLKPVAALDDVVVSLIYELLDMLFFLSFVLEQAILLRQIIPTLHGISDGFSEIDLKLLLAAKP